jgi:8-oxo-dGTP pyrophosphatase MutT (NUDIX family)
VATDAQGRRVLVLLRPKREGPDGLPEVRLPKGHIEPGESRRTAALREVHEEAGLPDLQIVADLGHQIVEFDWDRHHYIRDESYFLMSLPTSARTVPPEKQYERLWVTWAEALEKLTYEAEREWLRRARAAWHERQSSENVADQNPQQTDDYT